MFGPWINSAALVVGGGFGAALRRWIPKRVVDALPLTCGVISASIGTVMVNRIHSIPAVVLAMLGGAFLGELLFLERGLERSISGLQRLLGKAEHAAADDAATQTLNSKLWASCLENTRAVFLVVVFIPAFVPTKVFMTAFYVEQYCASVTAPMRGKRLFISCRRAQITLHSSFPMSGGKLQPWKSPWSRTPLNKALFSDHF